MHIADLERLGSLRDRTRAFLRFVGRRFVDDKCFEVAGALSYTTIFALVPLTTAALGIVSAFPIFVEWSGKVTHFVWDNFVPSAASVMQGYLSDFADNAKQLTGVGLAALAVSALLMLNSVEDTLNKIFRAPRRRSWHKRLVVYWTILTLGPLLAAASVAASAYILAWAPHQAATTGTDVAEPSVLWSVVPSALTFLGITVTFRLVPNCRVKLRHAAIGAAMSTALFLVAKQVFAAYLVKAPTYQQVFGALAAVPIFLVWIYVWWSVLLLGASLAASLSDFRYRPGWAAISDGQEFFALLRMLRLARDSIARGQPFTRAQWFAVEPGLTEEQADRLTAVALACGLAREDDAGALLPLHDGGRSTLAAMFERGSFRWPDALELEALRGRAAPEEQPLIELLDRGRKAQAVLLGATLDATLDTIRPSSTQETPP